MCTSGLLSHTLYSHSPGAPRAAVSAAALAQLTGSLDGLALQRRACNRPVNRDHAEAMLLFCTAGTVVADGPGVDLGVVTKTWKQRCLPVEPVILEN